MTDPKIGIGTYGRNIPKNRPTKIKLLVMSKFSNLFDLRKYDIDNADSRLAACLIAILPSIERIDWEVWVRN